jgi:hypothetical protein
MEYDEERVITAIDPQREPTTHGEADRRGGNRSLPEKATMDSHQMPYPSSKKQNLQEKIQKREIKNTSETLERPLAEKGRLGLAAGLNFAIRASRAKGGTNLFIFFKVCSLKIKNPGTNRRSHRARGSCILGAH